MGIARRLAQLFHIKANKALDRAEDPREVMDYSYQRQLEMLTKVRRGVADVATSRKRLELQLGQLQQSLEKLHAQAAQAVQLDRDDIAREALARRGAVQAQIDDISGQREALLGEEDKLKLAAQRLQAKVEAFRTRKETVKATYTAAEAQTRIGEAVSGISEEMGDVGLAMQRAEDKSAQLQARAGALDELLASGALDDASRPAGRDDLQQALEAARGGGGVDRELAALKAQALPSRETVALGQAEVGQADVGQADRERGDTR